MTELSLEVLSLSMYYPLILWHVPFEFFKTLNEIEWPYYLYMSLMILPLGVKIYPFKSKINVEMEAKNY